MSSGGVYERSDAKVRRQEGMELCKGFIGEPFDTDVEIEENGVRYLVDVKDGQKTGFFLDQKYNRLAIQKLCPGAKVLDCFTIRLLRAERRPKAGRPVCWEWTLRNLGFARRRKTPLSIGSQTG